jgi:hypothetical protein
MIPSVCATSSSFNSLIRPGPHNLQIRSLMPYQRERPLQRSEKVVRAEQVPLGIPERPITSESRLPRVITVTDSPESAEPFGRCLTACVELACS